MQSTILDPQAPLPNWGNIIHLLRHASSVQGRMFRGLILYRHQEKILAPSFSLERRCLMCHTILQLHYDSPEYHCRSHQNVGQPTCSSLHALLPDGYLAKLSPYVAPLLCHPPWPLLVVVWLKTIPIRPLCVFSSLAESQPYGRDFRHKVLVTTCSCSTE